MTMRDGGMANLCCMCDVEIPARADQVKDGYCSEKCWDDWWAQNKHRPLAAPYVPMQTTRLKFDTTQFQKDVNRGAGVPDALMNGDWTKK